jgi:hypothetical protein
VQTDRLKSSLILRIREAPATAPAGGVLPVEIEVLLNLETIFCAQPTTFDLNQLNASFGKGDNAYGRLLGAAVCGAASVQDALGELGDPGGGVRVQLMLEGHSPVLESIKWERMEIASWKRGPLAVNQETPFSRFAAVSRRVEEAPEDQVFRLMVAVASPRADGVCPVDTDAECVSIVDACAGLLDRNQVEITLLGGLQLSEGGRKRLTREGMTMVSGATTADRIAGLLSKVQPHGLHIVAHGTYNALQRQFYLLLENEAGGLGAKTAPGIDRILAAQASSTDVPGVLSERYWGRDYRTIQRTFQQLHAVTGGGGCSSGGGDAGQNRG